MVSPPSSTVQFIRNKVRRLTASSSESSLTTNDIDQYINNFYTQDFPYAIKLDQLRSVYTFFTSPNIDRYPLNINANQGMRSPVYFEGVQGFFYKDRQEFYNLFPRWPTQLQPATGDGTTQQFSFTVSSGTPFLSQNVVIGGTDTSGNTIRVSDDGFGNLLYITTDSVGDAVPPLPATSPIPPNPLPDPPYNNVIGTVDYVTGAVFIDFTSVNITPADGSVLTMWIAQYSPGRPYTLLFWNNEFHVRPVPNGVYKVEIESYMTPVEFMNINDNPTLNQWAQYIAYGAAREILRDRQDMEGVANLEEGFMRQEALVLERQGTEEIGQRNTTIFSNASPGQNFGWWQNGWF